MIGQKYCYKRSLAPKYKKILRKLRRKLIANPWNLEMILWLDCKLEKRECIASILTQYKLNNMSR